MKKAAAALCCAVFLITGCLSGCSTQKTALTVGEAEVRDEVYLYFLDQAARELIGSTDISDPPSASAPETAQESAAPATAASQAAADEPEDGEGI